MAGDAFTSRFHLSKMLTSGAGESPVAMPERAAWELRQGPSVTDAAWTRRALCRGA